jgi:hypothetical protein
MPLVEAGFASLTLLLGNVRRKVEVLVVNTLYLESRLTLIRILFAEFKQEVSHFLRGLSLQETGSAHQEPRHDLEYALEVALGSRA